MVKDLREKTGAGVMATKKALEECDGDMQEAAKALTEMGLAAVAKRVDRETTEGVVGSYVHTGNRIGALVEMNCETDFVARTPEFAELAHDIAMQVASMAPQYVVNDDVPEEADEVPAEKILLEQAFIKDPSKTVRDLVAEVAARVRENIRVRRFSRFELGE
ncbi:MAG: elongation factor Ts [Chloroflexi bacterium]|nr:elongation factor Ts [Chloroflexota bacterium]